MDTLVNDGTQVSPTHRSVAGADSIAARYVWGVLRLVVGWVFFWAFIDKLFGLGFATCRAQDSSAINFGCDAAFIRGGSPTFGFLTFGTQSSHTGGLFDWLAPSAPTDVTLVDWVFMAALGFIGVALLLGVLVRLAGIAGALLVLFMYLAGFVWPANNPFIDEHILEFVVLVGFTLVPAGRWLGFGTWWANQPTVRKYPMLE